MPLSKHGRYKYIKDRCKCDICCTDHTIYRRELKWRKRKKFEDEGYLTVDKMGRRYNSHPDCPHGHSSGFNYWWCQCRACTDTVTNSLRKRRGLPPIKR